MSTPYMTLEQIDEAADAVRKRTSYSPRVALILGSGLNGLADSVQKPDIIPFGELPHMPVSTVHGHMGRLVIGELAGQVVFVMQGRVLFYEGYTMGQVTLPIRIMQRLKIEMLFVTNAAGGVNPNFAPGDVMLITDNLNLIGMTGMNPLFGPNLETRAEYRFLRTIGADVVGMSTVPEVIVARHGGMRVMGLSGISNKANLDGSTVTTHEEVIEAGKMITPKVEKITRGVLRSL
jgi:purine-nucleoside phosphorylase